MALSVDGLTVRFGGLTAVAGAHLDIADGEVLALLGPSGSGKSTLLRAITGLEQMAAGTVRWDGADLAAVPVHQRGFGLVFQDGQLFPHRDVAGNVAFGLRMHGVEPRRRAERVAELLELVGLRGYERRRVTQLSGGEAQRVALARALAPEPRLLLLDEPLSGLDAGLREQLAFDLTELLRRTKITTLLVTHDQEEAFTLADRVAVLDGGEIRQVGDVDDVWRCPATEPVARFLGVTTTLDATVFDGVLHSPLGTVGWPGREDGTVRIGLRPNGVRALPGGGDGLPAEVLGRAHRRDHTRLLVRPTDWESTVDAVAASSDDVRPGDRVRLLLVADGMAVLGG
ncbi:ABC transporter [Amycolatopsis antarctica]|uniref:ABC-type quaternary amine transporter n=1 Tax=Amycolatopsis antarctica TaxID=1854586 RepID=A0A263D5G6_9PSEU|nr:ABC transporter ATP-binding protein [Amycolatopsis antarctica]OZM73663.1 ABC transporter [Amycolatopsis antarctica]